uniref:Ankyrin repeat domain-containing protein n=1 Tax=Panagrolaimus superbus TaxID=310955 RepID=A0A914XX44_9BILA
MKEAAMNFPEEETDEHHNLRHIKDALESLISCLREYSVCQKDYNEWLQYVQERCSIEKMLGASEVILRNLEIEEIFIKSLCDNYTFEERKDALLNVREKLTTDIQMLNYYKYTIRLIKNNQEEFGEAIQDIWVLEEQYNIFKEKTKDFKDPSTIITDSTFTDESDAITDDEILQILEEKWKKFDRIEFFKTKLNKIDVYDATDLNHIKFLIEECGYNEIIDKPDNAGITPLMNSIINDRNDIFEYLLQKGAKSDPPMRDLNASSSVSSTPLMEAILERNVDAIRLLLQHNANPLLKNKNAETAMDLLKEQLRTGHMFLTAKKTLYGPKHAKKEMPMSQETFDELQTVQKLLRKSEKKFAKNHPEMLQNESIGENIERNISRKRRHESIDPIENM